MKDSILALIRDRQHVSFVDLSESITGFKGDVTMLHALDPNVVLWPWCSDTAIDAILELTKANLIFPHPASTLVYMIDGLFPALPQVVNPPEGGYNERRWLPICFCDYPIESD